MCYRKQNCVNMEKLVLKGERFKGCNHCMMLLKRWDVVVLMPWCVAESLIRLFITFTWL